MAVAARTCVLLAALALAAASDPTGAAAKKRWSGLLRMSTEVNKKVNPVTKVIGLLKDMAAQLEKEADQDAEAYEKMQCWCKDGEAVKTKAIEDNKQKMIQLGPVIEEYEAKEAQLSTEIEGLREDIKKNEVALKEAQALRYKEAEDFMQEERDGEDTIRATKTALKVLSANHDAALPQEAMLQVRQVIKGSPKLSEKLQRPGLNAKDSKLVAALLEKNPHLQEYAPQSGELVGMLNTMLEEFEENLETIQAEEKNAAATFASLKPAKENEMRAQNKQLRQKIQTKTKADQAGHDSIVERKQAETVMKADERALVEIRETCPVLDAEHLARTKIRQDESIAISEAIEILSDDDARDGMQATLAKKVGGYGSEAPSFFQLASTQKQRSVRNSVSKLLLEAAKKRSNSEMALLALAVKEDVFVKVRESIDNMVEQLNKQEKDEFKHKDYCKEEFQQNTLQTDEKYNDKDNQEKRRDELVALIETRTEEIRVANAEIVSTQIEMKQAFEVRQGENSDFAVIYADQRTAKETLNKALARLQEFYGKRPELLQTKANSHSQQGQPEFSAPFKKSSGAKGVMNMIKEIIADTTAQMKETTFDEHESQKAYEDFGRQQNKVIRARQQEIAQKTEEKAEAEEELVNTKADLKVTMTDLEELHNYEAGIHRECDFILDNFQARRDARAEEIQALNEAKAMMSGMA